MPPSGRTTKSRPERPWPAWLRTLGSVWFAVALLGALAVLLVVSTSVESTFGTARAQRFFYQAGWFDAFLALLGVNIIAATTLRWPFLRKHTGFIVTHVGIVTLLVGSLLSRLAGVEGQMPLLEGEKSSQIAASELELTIGSGTLGHGHTLQTVPLNDIRKGKPFATLKDGTTLELRRFEEKAVLETRVEEAPAGAPRRPALRLRMQSQLTSLDESFWLVSADPHDAGRSSRMLGPARLELIDGSPPAAAPAPGPDRPRLVFAQEGNELVSVDLHEPGEGQIAVGTSGFWVRGVRYLPDARVDEGGKLVTVSQEPRNPAVEAELVAPDGGVTKIMKFALFPDFESMHGRAADGPPFEILFKGSAAERPADTPELTFYAGESWNYRYRSPKGAETSGVLEEGKDYPAGWMDFRFTVERMTDRAVVRPEARAVSGKNGRPAVYLVARKDGAVTASGWLSAGSLVAGPGGHPLPVRLRERLLPVPFELTLKDFRKVNYPGSNRAASFESDVTLEDASEGFSISRTIRMNEPLDYKGFRIFQSSYVEDPGGDVSIFTVAKNPGIPLIYGGSIVLFLGMFLTFFVPSLSSVLKPTEK